MQIACFLQRILLLSVDCLAVPYIFTLSHKRQNFRKKMLNTLCFDFSAVFFLTFHILRIIRQDIMINVDMSSFKVSVILVRFA
jgi:hypothetical protein